MSSAGADERTLALHVGGQVKLFRLLTDRNLSIASILDYHLVDDTLVKVFIDRSTSCGV